MAAEALDSHVDQGHDGHAVIARGRRIEAPLTSELVPVAALLLAGLLTVFSFASPWVHLAYRLPRMHAIIDTTIGLVSLLLAYLV